jgi:hypothetical protein
VEKPDDRHFSLMQLILLEEVRKNIKREHGLHVGLDCLVSAFGHVGNQIEKLHKVFPSRRVFLLADLVIVSEPSFLEYILVDGSFSVDLIVLLGESDLVETADIISAELFNKVREQLDLVAGVDVLAD